jgi:hypothetical protein
MREVLLYPDGLKLEEGRAPVPGEGDVLVRVHAAAITSGELEWPVDRLPAVRCDPLGCDVDIAHRGVRSQSPEPLVRSTSRSVPCSE